MTDEVKTKMTAAEFFDLPETTQPVELIEGELIVSPTPVPKHARTSVRFVVYLDDLVPNGEIFDAPMEIYLDDENTVQPDIFWVAENGRCKEGEKRFVGAPELIIDILSPGSVRLDKITKFKLYERHGVTEYWIVDPIEQYVEVYRLENGRYMLQGTYGPDMSFESAVLGKTVDLNQIFPKA